MDILDQKVIDMSKTKILLLIMGAFVFVGISFWLTTLDEFVIGSRIRFNNPWLIYGVGWFGAIFFGICGVFGAMQLFKNKPGLILNNMGITENLGSSSARFIPWDDINGFNVHQIHQQKLFIILLKEPGKYTEVGNFFRRSVNRTNYKTCGSPIVISANSLKTSFDELLETCKRYFEKYGMSE